MCRPADGTSNSLSSRKQKSSTSVADEWSAGLLSKITFSWLFPLIKLGHERQLVKDDVGENLDRDLVEKHLLQFEENLRNGTREDFRYTIFKTFSRFETYAVICKFVSDAMGYVVPFAISYIVSYAENPADSGYEIWLVAVAMFISAATIAFCNHWFYQFVMIDGLHARTAIQAAVYAKMLRINVTQSGVADTITNLYSTDCVTIEFVYQMWMYLWAAPLQLLVTTALLYLELGWPVFVGIGILFLNGPLQKQVLGLLKQDTKIASECSDRRIKKITEILQGIQVVKLQAWEDVFMKKVETERATELKHRRSIAFLNGANTALTECAPIVSTVVTFIVYSMVSEEPLTAAKAFTSLALFNLLRLPLFALPLLIGIVASAVISSNRLGDFFYSDELKTYVIHEECPPEDSDSALVEVQDSSFVWQETSTSETPKALEKKLENNASTMRLDEEEKLKANAFTLTLDDLKLLRGTLTVITGTVGSGKSSVLSAILGEMSPEKENVSVTMRGSISYCAQQPWIQNATVRDNITFGSDFDPIKYKKVLEACALNADIAALPAGDETEIGERGINLSGGQKARVSLARACYADTDIVILDDILSAVDAHVARTITNKCLVQLLRDQGKAVLLATHQTLCLPEANNIIVMKDGSIAFKGDFHAAKSEGILPEDFASSALDIEGSKNDMNGSTEPPEDAQGVIDSADNVEANPIETQESSADTKKKGKLTKEEKTEEGAVTLAVYIQYLKLMGIPMFLLILFLVLSVNGSQVAVNWWLSRWSTSDGSDSNYYYYVYAAIGFGACLCIFAYQIAFVYGGLLSAAGLHKNLLEAILHAPMSFFDTTPSGQILNRFTVDMKAIDETLVKTLSSAMNLFFMMFFVIGTMVAVLPYILVAIVPLFFFYGWVQRIYRNTARELKRFDSATQSPIFNFFSETVDGLASVRAFRCQDRLLGVLKGHVDTNTRFWTKSNFVNRWLGIRLDLVGAILTGAAGVCCVMAIEFDWVTDAGLIGLVLSYTATLTGLLNWGVRNFSEAEMAMVAVERTRNMAACPQEQTQAPMEPPSKWPSEGKISFQDFSVRYRESLPKVLNELALEIPGGTKVGICGRTGSGKSTLAKCLFRLIESNQGAIEIDGINIARVELMNLRSKISMISQDPVLFAGPLRYSLDPANQYSDAELWRALDSIGMKSHVEGMPSGLEAIIEGGGENLSAGQRQLLCMARALLEKPKLLIMDEATSNIDGKSDGNIQVMLKEAFKDCTVLTIAHRIDTILWYDKVLVLDHGKVLEYGSPEDLSKKEDSAFKALLSEYQKGRGATNNATTNPSSSAGDGGEHDEQEHNC